MKKVLLGVLSCAQVLGSATGLTLADTTNSAQGQVVSDQKSFSDLVSKSQANGQIDRSLAGLHRDEALLQAAANIFGKTHDLQKYADFLAHNGFIVFLPPQDLPVDSQPSNVTIYKPVESYDYSTARMTISGSEYWNDLGLAQNDFPLFSGNVGGLDSIGLDFSNIPNPSQVVAWGAQAYDSVGDLKWGSNTWYSTYNSSGAFTAQFEGQDQVCTNSSGNAYDYSWYNAIAWVTFATAFSAHGNVTTTYSHTWSSSAVTGFTFDTGYSGASLPFGLTVEWNNSQNAWAANSLYLAY